MTLKEQLQADIIAAMKARETAKLGTLRLLSAAIKQREVDTQTALDDAAVLAIIEKACKQRKESIAQFEIAKRQDLVDVEQAELAIISAYLPAQMSDDEVAAAVNAAIASTGDRGQLDRLGECHLPPALAVEMPDVTHAAHGVHVRFVEGVQIVESVVRGIVQRGNALVELDPDAQVDALVHVARAAH